MTTPSQTVGPYFTIGMVDDDRPLSELDPDGVAVEGVLYDGQSEPIPDGLIELWDPVGRRWGRSGTDAEGGFSFRVPAGTGRFEVLVFARGLLRHQWTRLYVGDDAGDEVLAAVDPARRPTLIARHDGEGLRFDIRLQGDDSTVFFAH